MQRGGGLNRITEALAQLESYLKLNSPAGLAENSCVPLLKHVYGHDLVNVNAESKIVAGIDLLDRAKRLAVQVTINDTTEKTRETAFWDIAPANCTLWTRQMLVSLPGELRHLLRHKCQIVWPDP